MPLTKKDIVEIQEAAYYNYNKRVRDLKEKQEFEANVARKQAEAAQPSHDEAKPVKRVEETTSKKVEDPKKGK